MDNEAAVVLIVAVTPSMRVPSAASAVVTAVLKPITDVDSEAVLALVDVDNAVMLLALAASPLTTKVDNAVMLPSAAVLLVLTVAVKLATLVAVAVDNEAVAV